MTNDELKQSLIDTTYELVYRDMEMGGSAELLISELFGLVIAGIIRASEDVPRELVLRILGGPMVVAFEVALQANIENLRAGNYDKREKFDA